MNERERSFESERARLLALGYRMLGGVADAEDVVQEAWLRWQRADESVDHPRAWLVRVVTRLCIDRLRAASAERARYKGPWLPEPLVERADGAIERAEEVSLAFLMALERLSPLERAAFLLHDVFDRDYDEIAATLERSEAACRQLATRARAHLKQSDRRFRPSDEEAQRLTHAFLAAAATGDLDGLRAVLAPDAVLVSDGGGKRRAALRPVVGRERVARFFHGIRNKPSFSAPIAAEPVRINGMPGVLIRDAHGLQAICCDAGEDGIRAIYVVSNPDKLRHVLGPS
jgi:RNA polymerase sigma-70 factor, ECF subfamily